MHEMAWLNLELKLNTSQTTKTLVSHIDDHLMEYSNEYSVHLWVMR